jgi:hypothetical protein
MTFVVRNVWNVARWLDKFHNNARGKIFKKYIWVWPASSRMNSTTRTRRGEKRGVKK